MTLQQHRALFHSHLSNLYPAEEIDSFFFLTTHKYLSFTKADAVMYAEKDLSAIVSEQFIAVLDRLQRSEPIQYIFGETTFYQLPITVNRDTLIPRPETEELVSWMLEDAFTTTPSQVSILDLGTGSGCIAIALAKHWEKASVWAWDISKEALAIAQKNAFINKVKINFEQVDILTVERIPHQFDIMVSNPPYVRELEKSRMQKNVLHYEPHAALFVSDLDPLLFYRKIATLAKKSLAPKGLLYFEINEYLGLALIQLLEEEGYTDIILKKDFFGKNRMIRCSPHEKA